MSNTPSDKYLHFTVGLLKDSATLEALQEDAMKHHMVDHPGQLIALRLSEYYEMMNRGMVQPVLRVPSVSVPLEGQPRMSPENNQKPSFPEIPATPVSPVSNTGDFPVVLPTPMPQSVLGLSPAFSQTSPHLRALQQHLQQQKEQQKMEDANAVDVIFASSAADENADDAADYWTAL